MKLTHRFAEPDKRLQDPYMDGTGLRFETMEHGGEYLDTMPQAIKLIDAESRNSQPGGRVPLTVAFLTKGSPKFTFVHFAGNEIPQAAFRHWAVGRIRWTVVLSRDYFVNQVASLLNLPRKPQTPSLLPS